MNDNLINKDIVKVNILIDTQDLKTVAAPGIRSHSDYYIKFDENLNNDSGFGGIYRNVIGLRLKSAIIRHDPIIINDTNNIIRARLTNPAAAPGQLLPADDFEIIPEKFGFYSGSGIAQLFRDAANFTRPTTGAVALVAPLPGCSFNQETQRFVFNQTSLDFTQDPTGRSQRLARVLGFNRTWTQPLNLGRTSSIFPIDVTAHFIDVVVDEIPYIACKQNASGRKIIDRIPITVPVGGIQNYKVDPAELQSQNYFYPITLSQLSIKLYSDNDKLITSSDEHHSLEFEITMLKHNKFR